MQACCGAGGKSRRIARAHDQAVREHQEHAERAWHERFTSLRRGHERQIQSMQDELARLTEQQRQLKAAKEQSHARIAALGRRGQQHPAPTTSEPVHWEHTTAGHVLEKQSAAKLAEVKERYEAQLGAMRQELATMEATMKQLKDSKEKIQSEKEYLELLRRSEAEVSKPR